MYNTTYFPWHRQHYKNVLSTLTTSILQLKESHQIADNLIRWPTTKGFSDQNPEEGKTEAAQIEFYYRVIMSSFQVDDQRSSSKQFQFRHVLMRPDIHYNLVVRLSREVAIGHLDSGYRTLSEIISMDHRQRRVMVSLQRPTWNDAVRWIMASLRSVVTLIIRW